MSSPHVQRDAAEDDESRRCRRCCRRTASSTAAAVLEQQLAGGAGALATAAFAALADICKAVVKQGGETVPLPQQREQELPLRVPMAMGAALRSAGFIAALSTEDRTALSTALGAVVVHSGMVTTDVVAALRPGIEELVSAATLYDLVSGCFSIQAAATVVLTQ